MPERSAPRARYAAVLSLALVLALAFARTTAAQSSVAVVESDGMVLLGEPLAFGIDSGEVRANSFPVLEALAQYLRTHASVRLCIEGHSGNPLREERSMVLSRSRAESVRDFLVSRGVDRERLRAIGWEARRPLVPPGDMRTAAGRRAFMTNRRIEFRVLRADSRPCEVY